MEFTRRQFLGYAAIAATAKAKTTQGEPDGFFTLGQLDDHWWLITPEEVPFLLARTKPYRPGNPALSREHSHLARQVRRQHNAMDPRVGGAQPQGVGLQHRRLGPGSDRAQVEALSSFHE